MSLTPHATYAPNPAPVRAQSTKLSAHGARLVYPSGRCVVVRDLACAGATRLYAEHTHPVTVARISPSGFYCASADAAGHLRVWDLVGGECALKLHVHALGGRVHDLAWDAESKRVIVVGEGREALGRALLVDTGSSVGEIAGHSKPINAVAIRPHRPFRAVTVGDDANVTLFTGVPYRYERTLTTHSRFVHDAAYVPDGHAFLTAGADGRIVVYDGASGDVVGELRDGDGGGAHDGSVYALSVSPDGAHVVSGGADGRLKLWALASRTLAASWTPGGDRVAAQQVGVVHAGARIVSVASSGELHEFSAELAHVRVLQGATRSISSLVARDAHAVGGALDGAVYAWSDDACVAERLPAGAHGRPGVTDIALAHGGVLAAALDGRVHPVMGAHGGALELDGPAAALAAAPAGNGAVYAAGARGLAIDGRHISAAELGFEPTAIAVAHAAIAVGGADARVRLYSADGALAPLGTLDGARSPITALAFSPDGALLAAGEGSGKIRVYDVPRREVRLTQWVFHSARISAIAWAPDGRHAASASLDTHIYIWSVERPMRHVSVKNAHAGGANAVAWLSGTRLASAGADAALRTYEWAPPIASEQS